jgi:hypothetical protein
MTGATIANDPRLKGKTAGDLGREALWFTAHSALAVVMLLVLLFLVTMLAHPDPESDTPKLAATLLAFLVPAVTGLLFTRVCHNEIGKYVWISGLLFFSFICVWVIDLPTGPGQCDHCQVLDRLVRTFFDIHNGSGLMNGNGLAIGTWIPLSLFGYAAGSRVAGPSR